MAQGGAILSGLELKVAGCFAVHLRFGEHFAVLGHHQQCLSQQASDTHHGDDDDLC